MWGAAFEGVGTRLVTTSLQSLRAFGQQSWAAAAVQTQAQRGIISVDVVNNQAEKAARTLRRKVLEEGFRDTWKAQSVFVKPCHKRIKAEAETEKRLKKRAFKEKLRWIMRRNARGF